MKTVQEAKALLDIHRAWDNNNAGLFVLIDEREVAQVKDFLDQQQAEIDRLNDLVKNQSDGYHTFTELYEHRHTLFCQICNTYEDRSWKSKLHSDETMFDGWFIAGIQTPQGQATYHLPISWWNKFDIPELEKAPEWDGHTSNDVVHRLSLPLGSLLEVIEELKAELDKWKPKFEDKNDK